MEYEIKNTSIKKNVAYNMIKQGCAILFPLITFSYASHILGAENIGKVSFSQSIISYVSLIASLGISGYAIREGVKYRNDRIRFEQFASELYTVNAIATSVAYLMLIICVRCNVFLEEYALLLFILSLSMVMNFVGADWVNSIYEDYRYLSIRYIIVQIISLFFLFVFVKSSNDLIIYTAIFTFANAGGAIFNIFYVKRYARLKLVLKKKIFRHMEPLLFLFGANISVIIYVNSDITILSFFSGDYVAGIYSAATKIYQAIKHLMFAAVTVMIPRLSHMIAQKEDEKKNDLLNKTVNRLLFVILPSMIGLWFECGDILYIFSGKEYVEGSWAVRILCIAILFSVISNIFNNGVLLPYGQERIIFWFTITACVTNVGLNIILIPIWGMNGAAITTVAAELISAMAAFFCSRKYVEVRIDRYAVFSECMGCIAVGGICFILGNSIDRIERRLLLSVFLAIIGYLLVEIALRNPVVRDIQLELKCKERKRKK